MSCQSQWDMEFIRLHLSKYFLESSYRRHQIQVFLSEAEATVGALQPFVHLQQEEKRLEDLVQEVIQNRLELQRRLRKLQKPPLHIEPSDKKTVKEHQKQKRQLVHEISEQYRLTNALYHRRLQIRRSLQTGVLPEGTHREDGSKEKTRSRFYFSCPRQECRGQVSHVYKCGLCHHWICPDCHADKGLEPNTAHECAEDDRQTVKILKDNTKSCPTCHEGIFKVSGCDQMWCTQCHTCFSWKSGNIINGTIHNPHYYEFQRQQNAGDAPRVVGDFPCNDGLPTWMMVRVKLSACEISDEEGLWMENVHQLLSHLDHVVLRPLVEETEQKISYARRMCGIEFLKHELTRDEWGKKLYIIYRKQERRTRLRDLFDMVTLAGGDLFRGWLSGAMSFEEWKECLDKVFVYANEQIQLLNQQYNLHIPFLHGSTRTYSLSPHL